MKTQYRNGRAAFTLIELLVVIAIISTLASLLLPALSAAREKGRAAVCASNLHQLGIAAMAYTDDYNGYLPGQGAGWPNPACGFGQFGCGWVFQILPYLGSSKAAYKGDNKLLFCPSDPRGWKPVTAGSGNACSGAPSDWTFYPLSYAQFINCSGTFQNCPRHPAPCGGCCGSGYGNVWKIHQIPKPGWTAFLVDKIPVLTSGTDQYQGCNSGRVSGFNNGGCGGPFPIDYATHFGRAKNNYLMLDGHVESLGLLQATKGDLNNGKGAWSVDPTDD